MKVNILTTFFKARTHIFEHTHTYIRCQFCLKFIMYKIIICINAYKSTFYGLM